jgi:26S proteasome regulatory subunit N6
MAEDYGERCAAIVALRAQSEAGCAAALERLLSDLIADDEHREALVAVFERALVALLSVYVGLGDEGRFQALLGRLRPYFAAVPKARTAKLVRLIIQDLRRVPGTQCLQVALCREWIEWAISEDRTVIRQRLETELSEILLEQQRYADALAILHRLTGELRKVDHKSQLIEVHLIESRTYRGLGDFNRAKAALTAARTNAAAVYTAPTLQGQLDLESGILFTEESDFRTASSYFSEAFDAFANANDRRAVDALKYGLLTDILDGRPHETAAKAAAAAMVLAKFAGDKGIAEVDAVLEMARASEAKSLHRLNEVLESRRAELEADPVVVSNVRSLIDTLEESHLLRIVKPFSAVQLSRIAEMISLPVERVESRLVQMILDQKLKASINQSGGILNIFEDEAESELLTESINLLQSLDGVVDALYTRCKLIS